MLGKPHNGVGAVLSGSTLFASIPMLNNKQTLSNVVILLAFELSLLRCYGTMIQLPSNKITPRFLLLPMSKLDQS